MKVCTSCHQRLVNAMFYKSKDRKNHPDGRDCRCKDCRRREKREEYQRKRKKEDGIFVRNGVAVIHKGCSTKLYWSETKINEFKRKFPYMKNEDLAIDFECSMRTVARRAREYGVTKDDKWLHSVWDKNRKYAQFINKVQGNKADLTNFIKGGIKHRFQKGHTRFASSNNIQL